MELVQLLLNPKVIGVLGVSGALLLGFCFVLYRLYIYQRNKTDEAHQKIEEIQEKRVQENREMQKEYYDLAADMDKTLDSVLKAIRTKNSGDNNGRQ